MDLESFVLLLLQRYILLLLINLLSELMQYHVMGLDDFKTEIGRMLVERSKQ